MTDDEVLALLAQGNEARAQAKERFRAAYEGATTEIARCWAAHLVAVEEDEPGEKLRWNLESLRAAEATEATGDARASGLFPTVLGNVGLSELLLARPQAARARYLEARARLEVAGLPEARRAAYRRGIDHMLAIIDAAGG